MKFHSVSRKKLFNRSPLALAVAATLSMPVAEVSAQAEEELVIRGIRASLTRAMDIKRESTGVVDSISAEDVGKFPDLNVAESLQRITGVAIDRSGGEGQQVTVRGFGPQFNVVLVNGRQLASDAEGRSFNFDVLSADVITAADVYKSTRADLQEGAIGATINLKTARPFDHDGFQAAFSVKGMYETLSEETSPSASILLSNTFADGKFGALLSYSHSERDVQINRIQTAGWRPNLTLTGGGETVASGVYFPRNWDQIVQSQDRTRDNASLVFQFAPNDDITVTLDGWVSNLEVDVQNQDLASWFEPDRVGSATISENNTAVAFTQEIGLGGSNPASDFVPFTRGLRDVSSNGGGINVEWNINDSLVAKFDVSGSTSEDDIAGQERFNVLGIINNYEFDGTGGTPTVVHDGFSGGSLPDASLAGVHYQERGNGFATEDEITEYKVDLEYTPDSDVFRSAKFGAYRQEREKFRYREFDNTCNAPLCSYVTQAPIDLVDFRPFTANNYFDGLIDTWYTFDPAALEAWTADQGPEHVIDPVLLGDRFTVNEDVTSFYMDYTFGFDVSDMPVTVNTGARYAITDVSVAAVQQNVIDIVPTSDLTLFRRELGDAQNITSGTSYADLLPSLSVKMELQDDMVLRFAAYESMSRPTMSQMSPSTSFDAGPRRQSLTGSGGNAELVPFKSENWDLSYEWYYSDDSLASFALFSKEVENFINVSNFQETYQLSARSAADGFRCSSDPLCAPGAITDPSDPTGDYVLNTDELNGQSEVYTIRRPANNSVPNTVTGMEAAITHVFDIGFGVSANATFVDSAEGEASLTGLGDSQNLVVFYEQDNWQARIAFNNREAFLFATSHGQANEPVTTEGFGQVDISGSFDVSENFTLFFEGINVTGEELRQHTVFPERVMSIEDNGSRYAFGVRGKF